jgi:NADH dehydrogenase (ubiquinone) Fe-S protein 6
MYASRLRVVAQGLPRHLSKRPFSVTARQLEYPSTPSTVTTATTADSQTTPQVTEGPVPTTVSQAPNRAEVWSRSQKPRSTAMTGPRFEQTDLDAQVGFRNAERESNRTGQRVIRKRKLTILEFPV